MYKLKTNKPKKREVFSVPQPVASWHPEEAGRGGGRGPGGSALCRLGRGACSRQLASLPWSKLAFQIFQNSRQHPTTAASPSPQGRGTGARKVGGCRWPADTTAGKLKALAQAWLLCWVLPPLGRGGGRAAGPSSLFSLFLYWNCLEVAVLFVSKRAERVSRFPCPSCSWSPSCSATCNYASISQPFVLGRCL